MLSSDFTKLAMTVILIHCTFVSAQADKVDSYISTQMRQLHIPGVSLAVIRNGQIIKARGYGVSNVELRTPATKNTVYEIGSMTKQFTATAVMMLVEDHKLSLDDELSRYFPDYPAWSHITVRNLLNHASGIQNYTDVADLSRTEFKRDEILKVFHGLRVEFEPGETWAYCNTGYYVLGMIVEKVSGKSFWEFLNERIFKPIGMTVTRNGDPTAIIANRASGYGWQNDKLENRDATSTTAAFSAGALVSTVEDLARWDAAIYTEKLVQESSLNQMWTPIKLAGNATAPFNYGFGWYVDTYHGSRVIWHDGGTSGFSSAITRFVDYKLTIILLTNLADPILEPLARDIATIYVPSLAAMHGVSNTDQKTSQILKEALTGLLNGKPEIELFTPAMRMFLATSSGKSFWQWFSSAGELKEFNFAEREDVEGTRILRYRALLGTTTFLVSFVLAKDRGIAKASLYGY
jgi:CubicO group peptidase (beta-lactamase class C family)